MAYTKIPTFLRSPGYFTVAEDGKVSYVPGGLKKMTIVVPGPIYIEYSDVENIGGASQAPAPQKSGDATSAGQQSVQQKATIPTPAHLNGNPPALTLAQLEKSDFIRKNKRIFPPIVDTACAKKRATSSVPTMAATHIQIHENPSKNAAIGYTNAGAAEASTKPFKMGSDLSL